MIITKTVHGILTHPDGKPWSRSRIQFELRPGSFTSLHQVPPAVVKVQTDGAGAFSVNLWANDEGDIPSAYTCTLPNQDVFGFVLPSASPSPIELSVLRRLGITAQHPQYQTAIDFIAQYLANVGLGSADQVVLNPVIPGLAGTVQGAIAQLNTTLNTLPTKLVELDDVDPSAPPLGAVPTYQGGGFFEIVQQSIDGGNF